ncbi:MAG: DedA family protein [Caulobacteraceae bacterium]|nr:DedA family protein [Caulobacteraceae bacterium]
MLGRLYHQVMRLSASRHAAAALAAVAFAESSVFPIPPDALLIPMVLARPGRGLFYAGLCTAGSVAGGLAGYAIGYFLAPVGHWLLSLMGHPDGEAAFRAWFAQWGLWVILIKGLLPIPYKLVTIASGLAHFNLAVFVAASAATRGLRFFAIAAVLKRYGPALLPVIERRLALIALGAVALAGAVLLAVRLLP